MELGEVLEAIVDEGEPSEHVPKSLKEDGQKILDQFKDDEGFIHIVVEKTVEY
jgi:TusA-related sulfurtransferase